MASIQDVDRIWGEVVERIASDIQPAMLAGRRARRFMSEEEPGLWVAYAGFRNNCKMSTTLAPVLDFEIVPSAYEHHAILSLDYPDIDFDPVPYVGNQVDPYCNDSIYWYEFEVGIYSGDREYCYEVYNYPSGKKRIDPYIPRNVSGHNYMRILDKMKAFSVFVENPLSKAYMGDPDTIEAAYRIIGLKYLDDDNPIDACGVVVFSAASELALIRAVEAPEERLLDLKKRFMRYYPDCDPSLLLGSSDAYEMCKYMNIIYGLDKDKCYERALEYARSYYELLKKYNIVEPVGGPGEKGLTLSGPEQYLVTMLGLREKQARILYRAARRLMYPESVRWLEDKLYELGISRSRARDIVAEMYRRGWI